MTNSAVLLSCAQRHADRTAGTLSRLVEIQSGDLARHAVEPVARNGVVQGVAAELGDGVAQRLLLAGEAEGRDDNLVDLLGGFAERDVEGRPRTDLDGGRFVADEVDEQFVRLGGRGDLQREGAVDARAGAERRAPDDHRSPDDGFAPRVDHLAADPHRFGGVALDDRKVDVLLIDPVTGVRPGDQLVQHRGQRFVGDIDREGAFDIDPFVYDEIVIDLFLDLIHNLLHAGIAELQRQLGVLGVQFPPPGGKTEAAYE